MFVLIEDHGRGFCARKVRMSDRVVVHLSSSRLDRELASGAAPESTPARALHAQRLVSPRSRRSLARSIRHVLGDAHRRATLISPALPLCRDRVRRAAPEFRAVMDHLLAGGPVPARGVAMLRVLLTSGSGPLYQRSSPEDLGSELSRIRAAFAGDRLTDHAWL